MIWRAAPEQQVYLLSQPESGMGYQLVEILIRGEASRRSVVVYQAIVIVELDEAFDMELEFLAQRQDWDAWALEPDAFPVLQNAVEFNVQIPPKGHTLDLVAEPTLGRCGRRYGCGGAVIAPVFKADGEGVFVRVSAFVNDNRVDRNKGCLIPGTFTTTLQDYQRCVKCPDDPVDRYALPNPLEITTAFFVRPSDQDYLQKGIVQPNFGKSGGGEEAFFAQGTSQDTLIDTRPYGQ
jgi:hypothetical protein